VNGSSIDNDTLVILLGFLTSILTSVVVLWRTASSNKHQREMFKLQHEADRVDRQQKAMELQRVTAVEAEAVRSRLETSALKIQQRVTDTAASSRVQTERALDAQTVAIANVVDQATNKADAAYHEANTVNVKLEKLHRANEQHGRVLEDLLHIIERRRSGSDPVVPGTGDRRADAGARAQEVIAIVAAEPIPKT
jgi:hypothetical protein